MVFNGSSIEVVVASHQIYLNMALVGGMKNERGKERLPLRDALQKKSPDSLAKNTPLVKATKLPCHQGNRSDFNKKKEIIPHKKSQLMLEGASERNPKLIDVIFEIVLRIETIEHCFVVVNF